MMEGWIDQAVVSVGDWPPTLVYLGIAVSAFLENVLPPVPGDLVVVLSAYLAGRGVLNWLPVYVATCLGGTTGFLFMYYLGRRHGRAFLKKRPGGFLLFSPQRLAQAEAWVNRRGAWLVLANRFLSGIRSVIALAAGMGGLRWQPVALLGGISMLVWNGGLLYLGLEVGQNWEQVTEWLSRYNRIVGGLLGAMALALGVRWWRRRATRVSVDSPPEGL